MEAKLQDTTRRATDNHSSSEKSDVPKWKADWFESREWSINENTTFRISNAKSLLLKIIENFSSNYGTFGGLKDNPNKEDKLKEIYEYIPYSVKDAIYYFKDKISADTKLKQRFSDIEKKNFMKNFIKKIIIVLYLKINMMIL